MEKLAKDLVPGDRYSRSYRGETVEVTIVGEQEPDTNVFGLPWFKYLAVSQGRSGYVQFGPTGTVTLMED